MKFVLLSGGSGKRLWPLSNDARSKQFIKVLGFDNNYESMVQRVWRQLQNIDLAMDAFITTNSLQVESVQNQLGKNIPLIIEPERRDTFPAIALACSYLYCERQVSSEEVIIVLPVDPYVSEAFFERVSLMGNVLAETNADITLLGVKPTYPSEKYGYIIPDSKVDSSYVRVQKFIEKPSEAAAEKLIQGDAYWNCGVFAFRLGYLKDYFNNEGLNFDYRYLLDNYNMLKKDSFDYEIVEKAKKIVMLPYDGEWKDLGTWNTLTEEMNTNKIGNVIISDDSTNSHVINELDLPIVAVGVHDLVVAASPDGIIISKKSESHKVKDLMKDYSHVPMYEERRWGYYRVLDIARLENSVSVTRKIKVLAGNNISYHYHQYRHELWTILQGSAEIVIDGIPSTVSQGDVIKIPPLAKHCIRALTELDIIEIQTGQSIVETDIERICYDWDQIFIIS